MITTILVSALGMLFAVLAGFKRYERALAVSFLVLFSYLALRYNFGNDYRSYEDAFVDINKLSSVDYFGSDISFEPGWVFLCRIFEPFGFYALVGVLAFLSCVVYWLFFLAYVPRSFYWLGFYLYTVLPENMLTQLSAMRQAVAIGLVVLAVDFLVKRKPVGYFVLVACAALFHFSAAIAFLLYFVGRDFKLNRLVAIGLFVLYVALFFYADAVVGSLLQSLSFVEGSTAVERYAGYEDKGSLGSGVGLAYYSMYMLSLLLAHNSLDVRGKVVVRLALLGVCLVPLVVSMAMLGRIALYLNIFSIAAIPLVAICIKDSAIRYAYVGVHVVFSARIFIAFFDDPIFVNSYSSYTTIFSALH